VADHTRQECHTRVHVDVHHRLYPHVLLILSLRRKLFDDDPTPGQHTLEVGILSCQGCCEDLFPTRLSFSRSYDGFASRIRSQPEWLFSALHVTDVGHQWTFCRFAFPRSFIATGSHQMKMASAGS